MQAKKGKTTQESEKVHSYMVHMAIYDPINKSIDTINYGVFDEVFPEIFNMTHKPAVQKTILKYFAGEKTVKQKDRKRKRHKSANNQ